MNEIKVGYEDVNTGKEVRFRNIAVSIKSEDKLKIWSKSK